MIALFVKLLNENRKRKKKSIIALLYSRIYITEYECVFDIANDKLFTIWYNILRVHSLKVTSGLSHFNVQKWIEIHSPSSMLDRTYITL